ncbi:MAG: hypothetical protein ABIP13_03625 [Tepidiformaceae bacterium]
MTESAFPIDRIVQEVESRLAQKRLDSPTDVYVWSDGSVTGPKENESEVSELKVIAVFSPTDESATAESVRTSIENGLRTSDCALEPRSAL